MDTTMVVAAGAACFGLFLVVVIVGAAVTSRRERERKEGLRRWAERTRWQFALRPELSWGRRLPGRNKRGVSLALSGALGGRPVTIAEYSYTHTTSSTNASGTSSSSSTTYHFVILVVRLRRAWPSVAVHRRGAMSRFGRALFGDRATAIGYEPFDSAFRVASDEPAAVRSVLGRSLVAEHVAGRLPEWSLQGDELLTFAEGRIMDPEGIPARFGPLLRVAELIERPAGS